jgi:hypothetical protein
MTLRVLHGARLIPVIVTVTVQVTGYSYYTMQLSYNGVAH